MNILKATKRTTVTSGQINKLRSDGFIPAVLYGGKKNNLNISLKKLQLQNIINTETFMSKVFDLDIDGSPEKALPREIAYDPISDEPIHIDFIRIEKGSKVILQIPVRFINTEKSPGLKKGGVLNIVRRKVELRCPTEKIPEEIVVDLDKTEIGTSIKISSVELPDKVMPTITDRDFVIATVASPSIVVEPVKAEETPEGEVPAEGTVEGSTDDKEVKEGEKEKSAKPGEGDAKDNKPSGEKKTTGEKSSAPSKETKKK